MTKELQDAANYFAHNNFDMHETNSYKELKRGFIDGAQWQQEISYSEEEVISLLDKFGDHIDEWYSNGFNVETETTEKWFNKYKKK